MYENVPDSEACPALDALADELGSLLAEGVTVALLELESVSVGFDEDDEAEVDVLEDSMLDEVVLVVELGLEGAAVVEWESSSPPLLPLPPPDFSKTTTLAFSPLGTVTTQKVAPPAPTEVLPIISLTAFTAGSILHGRPLQPSPSHSISIPKSGTTSRKGVVGSR